MFGQKIKFLDKIILVESLIYFEFVCVKFINLNLKSLA